jgi:hypothetical protein
MTNEKVKKLFDDVYSNREKVITEELAKQVLSEYGVMVPKYALVKSAEEAGIEAEKSCTRQMFKALRSAFKTRLMLRIHLTTCMAGLASSTA